MIELMIVIAIIAILAAILVPNFIRARAQAQLSACEGNLKQIATAMELYNTDYNGYPSTADAVTASPGKLQPTYLAILPKCPSNKTFYNMTTPVTPFTNYTVFQTISNVHSPLTGTIGVPPSCTFVPCYAASSGLII